MDNLAVRWTRDENGVEFAWVDRVCRVEPAAGALRVRFAFAPALSKGRSYAVLPRQPAKAAFDVEAADGRVTLRAPGVSAAVQLHPFAITVQNARGDVVHRDLPGRAYRTDRAQRRTHCFALDGFEHFYGFGEKGGPLNKFGRRLRMYSTDAIGYDAERTDPLYKHIPFFIKRDAARGLTCGVFYDCPQNGVFDIGCERSGYWDPYATFACDGGEIDYYILPADSLSQAVRAYTDLTGKTALPPLKTLGYMASTMYYTELEQNADQGIAHFIEELDRQGFPCDGFHLSSGYTAIGKKRYVFTWNRDRFPDPKAFVAWMNEKGVPLSPNIKPALLTDHPLYEEFAKAGAFIKDGESGKPYLERFWGGRASFVDFTGEAGRRLWKKYLKERLLSYGIPALWDDNNEYEILEEGAVCDGDGEPVGAQALKPVFANLMAKTALEAMAEADPERRPYILSRAGYAGIQRYAQTWAGDNRTSWHSLKFNIPIMLGMGLCGVANQGCDVGGFQGPAPDAELFVRWVQNGIFQPRFCIHSCNSDNTVTQPWSHEAVTPLIREAFLLRYRLSLYLYSLLWRASTLGDPIMRPMAYEFEEDPALAEESFDFMFGPALLVANVLEPGARQRTVYLPRGAAWFDFYTHQRYEGGRTVTVDAPLSRIPLFYRQGCILPLVEPGLRLTPENFQRVRLLVEAGRDCAFTLYEDDGETNAYLRGECLKTHIAVRGEAGRVHIDFTRSGPYPGHIARWEVELAAWFEAPLAASVGGKILPVFIDKSAYEAASAGCYCDMTTRHTFVKFDNLCEDFTLTVDFRVKDLIGIDG